MARRTVTEELFTSCKSLQAQGSSVYSAAQALKISDVTVRRIFKANSRDEYKTSLKKGNQSGGKPEPAKTEPKRDLAAAYRFLRDECIEVELNDMKHLIITVEVSKWESLF